jgi:hypothetical protein
MRSLFLGADIFSVSFPLDLRTGIRNLLCIVLPPEFAAAQPEGQTTATDSSVWNNVLMTVTSVWISVVFPVPARPRIVSRNGSNDAAKQLLESIIRI